MRFWMTILFAFLAALVSAADDTPALKPADDQVEKERATQALELCRKGAKEYRLCLDDPRRTELELRSDPVLRWSNPSVGSIHGGVFLWTHQGRPAAVASIRCGGAKRRSGRVESRPHTPCAEFGTRSVPATLVATGSCLTDNSG